VKNIRPAELRKRAFQAGLPRAQAAVLSVIGYWSQIRGGVKKGPGLPWKWRNYKEIGDEFGYSPVTIQRAVENLRKRKLIGTRRMHNPSKPGQTVNGFRLTAEGYVILGLPVPIGAHVCCESDVAVAPQQTHAQVGNAQHECSQAQSTFNKHHKDSESCSQEEKGGKVTMEGLEIEPSEEMATLEEVAAAFGYHLDA
jgi:hypothetical protein